METATTVSQINLMEMAKQGDMNALAALMNRSLKVNGLFAELNLTQGCLVVTAMFEQLAPSKASLVEMLKRGLGNIQPKGVQRVMVQAMSIRDRSVAWQSAFGMPEKPEPEAASPLASIASKVSNLSLTRGKTVDSGSSHTSAPAATVNNVQTTNQAVTPANSNAKAFPLTLPRQAVLGYFLLAIGVIMMFTGLGQGSQIAATEESNRGTLRAEALANKAIHAQAGGAMMIAGAVLVGAAGQRN